MARNSITGAVVSSGPGHKKKWNLESGWQQWERAFVGKTYQKMLLVKYNIRKKRSVAVGPPDQGQERQQTTQLWSWKSPLLSLCANSQIALPAS